MGQGQDSYHLNKLWWAQTPIPHTKFQGNQSIGSEEGVLNDFTIYVHGSHICHVTKLLLIY